jgi:acetyl esterase/lipase
MRLPLLVLVSSVFVSSVALAASDRPVIPLWPEGLPDPLRAGYDPAKTAEEVADGTRVSNIRAPQVTVFAPPAGRANGTAVVICPGGGYARLAYGHEGLDVASWLNAQGVTCFLLKYRHKEYGHPAPLRDVLRAIRLVRSRAAEFGVDPERIGVMGFSAGGHLASSAATLFDHADGKTGAALDAVSARPSFAILVYPVILMEGPHIHAGSRNNLIGEKATPELVARMSTDRQVSKDTPPIFLIHAQDDATVPVENALSFYAGARRAGTPIEMHLYEKGGHGFGLKPKVQPTDEWPDRCLSWMRAHGWLQ